MRSRYQRYHLLKGLAEDADRHMMLLTATPHSGDEDAFFNLLGLLRPDFAALKDLPPDARAPLRERLGAPLRANAAGRTSPNGKTASSFPTRNSAEITYRLSGAWGRSSTTCSTTPASWWRPANARVGYSSA